MSTKELLFLESALKVGPNKHRTSELTQYKSDLAQSILALKETDPDNFIIKARRYIEYQVVLDFAEREIQQLPQGWKKNLWRDAAMLYGDRVFDLMAEALEKYAKLIAFRNKPEPEEFATAIRDRVNQQLMTFPTMNNSDAEYITRYLELVHEGIENTEALTEYVELRKSVPSDWNMDAWNKRAAVFGKETLKYLRDGLVLENIMDGLIEETSSVPAWHDYNMSGRFKTIKDDLKQAASPIDVRLSVSQARKAATNFSAASFFIHTTQGLETRIKELFIERSLKQGGSTIKEFMQLEALSSLHERVASIQKDLGLPISQLDASDPVYFQRLVKYKSSKGEFPSIRNAGEMAQIFATASLIGMPLTHADTSLPDHSTIGCEQELFGIKENDYGFLDQALSVITPGTLRTKDATIRPTDDTQGMEIVSGVITQDFSHLIASTEILRLLGGKADLPCALHAHHGLAKIFEEKQLAVAKQVKLNYIAIEDDLAFLDSSLTHYYRQVLSDSGLSQQESLRAIIAAPEMNDLMRVTQPSGRRRARVNLQSSFEHGTMEFRQHPGTVEPAEVRGWIIFVSGFVDHAANMISENGQPRMAEGRDLGRLKELVTKLIADRATPIKWNLQSLPELNSVH